MSNDETKRDVFITSLSINKVRHLKNLSINLSKEKKRHLILTGKNGSGKTSLLNEIKDFILPIEGKIRSNLTSIKKYPNLSGVELNSRPDYYNELQKFIKEIQNHFKPVLHPHTGVSISYNKDDVFAHTFFNEEYVFAFFESNRSSNFSQPSGPKKIEIKDNYKVDQKANAEFVQHLINLRYNQLEAKESGKEKIAQNIKEWFEEFKGLLREIFNDSSLEFSIDSQNFKFNIESKGKETFDLTTLSDGFSAIINIISELMMRMEKKYSRFYDAQGLVLIDEIETHLHIDLQKKILPFLTRFFPKIQFIVTTHSPFVLTSIEDAVVYDLEHQEAIEDLSGYSVEAIIEGYFDSDKYSVALNAKVDEYEQLMSKPDLSSFEEEELKSLDKYFDDLSGVFADELKLKIEQIRLLNPVR